MTIVVLFLKLFIYSELYKHDSHCYPIVYYFGQKGGCRQSIAKYAHINSATLRRETFVPYPDPPHVRGRWDGGIGSGFRQIWEACIQGIDELLHLVDRWQGKIHNEVIYPALAKQIRGFL